MALRKAPERAVKTERKDDRTERQILVSGHDSGKTLKGIIPHCHQHNNGKGSVELIEKKCKEKQLRSVDNGMSEGSIHFRINISTAYVIRMWDFVELQRVIVRARPGDSTK